MKPDHSVPLFGARKFARELTEERQALELELDAMRTALQTRWREF